MTTNIAATNRLEAGRLRTDRLATSLPGYMMLADGEHVVQSTSFGFSLAHFFLSSRLVLTNKQLGGERPKVWLGLIPMGSEPFTLSLPNLASVGAGTRIRARQLIVGLIMLVAAAGGLIAREHAWPAALVGGLIVVGAVLALGALQAALHVKDNGGGATLIGVSIMEKGKAQSFADQINAALAGKSQVDAEKKVGSVQTSDKK